MRRKLIIIFYLSYLLIFTGCLTSTKTTSTEPARSISNVSLTPTSIQLPGIFIGSSNVNSIRMVPGISDGFGGSGPMQSFLHDHDIQSTLNAQGFAPLMNNRGVLSYYKEEGSLRVYIVNLPDTLPLGNQQRIANVQGLVTFGDPETRTISSKAIAIYSLRSQPHDVHIIAAVCTNSSQNNVPGQIYLLMVNQAGEVLGSLQAIYSAVDKIEISWSHTGIVANHNDQTISFSPIVSKNTNTSQAEQRDIESLTILYTNDEHGWMAGKQNGSSAAELVDLWRELEGYGEDENILVISGGDNWTGPAISTWFDGQGMVETMNALDYDASTIGNHEFDFGLIQLKARISEAGFPYLSANLRDKSTGEIPHDLGIQPYTLLNINNLNVGIIGLTTLSTPVTSNPANLERFIFIDYSTALREYVPLMRSEGAKIIIVIAHVCADELVALSKEVVDLNIPFMGGGHCHQAFSKRTGNTVIQLGGADLVGYAYTRITVNPENGDISISDYGLRKNTGGDEDPVISAIIQKWQAKTDGELNNEIGYLKKEIYKGSTEMQTMVTESWLIAYPNADIALNNMGGFREGLPSGRLTLAHIINMLPFDNYLVEAHLTGNQLEKVLEEYGNQPAIGGMKWLKGRWVLNKTDQPLISAQIYSVLVNDFMYAGGDGYTLLAQFDPDAYNTGIDWRQPVIDWIRARKSNVDNPLDKWINILASR